MTRPLSITLLIFIFLITAFFGLHPKNYKFDVSPNLSAQHGLSFPIYSLAYTKTPIPWLGQDEGSSSYIKFTLPELRNDTDGQFEVITSLESGEGDIFLIIGQWNEFLIFRKDLNFSSSQNASIYNVSQFATDGRFDNISVEALFIERHLVLKVNGSFIRGKAAASFIRPASLPFLFIGGSSDKTNTWESSILEFEFGGCVHDENYSAQVTPACTLRERWVSYEFMTNSESALTDLSGNGINLAPSTAFKLHRPNWLQLTLAGGLFSSGFLKDALLNIVGLIPFGFMFMVYRYSTDWKRNSSLLISSNEVLNACLFGFMFSLAIESLQLYLPSRSSSMYDLIFNTIGTWAGAGLFVLLLNKSNKFSGRDRL